MELQYAILALKIVRVYIYRIYIYTYIYREKQRNLTMFYGLEATQSKADGFCLLFLDQYDIAKSSLSEPVNIFTSPLDCQTVY